MTLRISGKHIDVGETMRGQIDERIGSAIGKYFDGGYSGQVVLEREGPGFRADCKVHLDTGIVLQAEGQAQDVRLAFDRAADRIEKRLRRYKRRLKGHSHEPAMSPAAAEESAATAYVVAAPGEDEDIGLDYSPVTIAEEATAVRQLTVSAAIVALDMSDEPVLVFRNASHGEINVVYRRSDGNIGWVDPRLAGRGDSRRR